MIFGKCFMSLGRMLNTHFCCALLVVFIASNNLPSHADTAPGLINTRAMCPEIDIRYLDYEQAYKERITSNMTETIAPEGFTILFKIDRDGLAKDISVFDSSKSKKYDVNALETFLTSFPLNKPYPGKTLDYYQGLLPGRVDFKPRKFQKKVDTEKNFIVHAIPLDVLNRYPGRFTKGELTEKNNLLQVTENLPFKALPVLPGTSHDRLPETILGTGLPAFFSAWCRYFQEHKTPSRDDLLKQRDLLLQKFKGLKRVQT